HASWQAAAAEARKTSAGKSEVLREPGRDLEVLLPGEGHVEDVEVLLAQPHAAEAVVAVGEVAAEDQIRRVGAGLALQQIGRGLAALALLAVAAVAAPVAGDAVGALVAAHALLTEHAVGAALAILAGVAAGVARIGGEGAPERGELIEELAASEARHRRAGFRGLRVELGGGRAGRDARGGCPPAG